MRKPRGRDDLPGRISDNEKRCIEGLPPGEQARLLQSIKYEGSSKHKRRPHLFGLQPFLGPRADETYCDETAGVTPAQMPQAKALLLTAVTAGLVGRRMLWSVAPSGWIFEFRITNASQDSFHGYPLLPTDPMAEKVYRAFATWAHAEGTQQDQNCAAACKNFYGIR